MTLTDLPFDPSLVLIGGGWRAIWPPSPAAAPKISTPPSRPRRLPAMAAGAGCPRQSAAAS